MRWGVPFQNGHSQALQKASDAELQFDKALPVP
jgi:hypothetical protein